VDQINGSNKKISYAYEEKVMVIQKGSGVPCDDKNAKGDHDREYFDKTMKEEIAM
jgi:hypothetical protein